MDRLVFYNGNVLTMDSQDTRASAIVVEDGRIAYVGNDTGALDHSGSADQRIDLEGRTLVPGFIDAHTHLELSSLAFETSVDCRSPGVKSIDEIIERLRSQAHQTPPGQWVKGQGSFFQDQWLVERRYPNRADLDRVSREHPVVFRSSFHVAILNSKGMELAGITRETPDPPGGMLERDPVTGEPTGYTKDMYHLLGIPDPSYDQVKQAIRQTAYGKYAASGVTSVVEISNSREGLQAMRELIDAGDFPLSVGVYLYVPGTVDLETALAPDPLPGVFDGDRLSLTGVKLFLDGGTTSAAAAFYSPYQIDPTTCGSLAYSVEELAPLVRRIHDAGRRLALHAVGDRAQDTALEAFCRAGVAAPERRHRIEHAGNLVCTEERIRRMQEQHLYPVPTPAFIYSFGDSIATYIGPERASRPYRLRTLLDAGFPLPGNSDSSGTNPVLISPLFGIWCAVTRQTAAGNTLEPTEAITPYEGLLLYTRYAAHAAGIEATRGTIEPGKAADLVVLGADPLTAPPETLKDIPVDLVFQGGRCTYSA